MAHALSLVSSPVSSCNEEMSARRELGYVLASPEKNRDISVRQGAPHTGSVTRSSRQLANAGAEETSGAEEGSRNGPESSTISTVAAGHRLAFVLGPGQRLIASGSVNSPP
jgi:hypothetical protein